MTIKNRLESLNKRQTEIASEIEALGSTDQNAENGELYAKALETVAVLNKEFDDNEKEVTVLSDAYNKMQVARNRLVREALPADDGANPMNGLQPGEFDQMAQGGNVREMIEAWDKIRLPSRAKLSARTKVFDSDELAYFSGLGIMAMTGNRWAQAQLNAVDYKVQQAPRNAMEGGTGSLGGYTVPVPLAAMIIRLVEEYGIFRQYSRVMPMTSATLDVPKRTAGLTVYYPGEGQAITASDLTFGQVNLVAKKAAQLAIWSTELDEDSIISMTDLLTTEMAWGFAQAEDTNSFLGDGSAPFNSITGIASALQAGAKVTADGGVGAATWAGITLPTYHAMVGKVKWYPGIQPVWFINHQGFAESMQALLYAAGGNTTGTVAAGTPMEFLGYPVARTQVLTRDPATSGQLLAVFGDLRLGTMLGNRRDITMQLLRELYAGSDQIGLVSTMRTDTQVHDVGDATEAGCIVGLYSP